MYIWKVTTGNVTNFGLNWDSNEMRGRMVIIRKYRSDILASIKSLGVHGRKHYNMLPAEIRGCNSTTDEFRLLLDDFFKKHSGSSPMYRSSPYSSQ